MFLALVYNIALLHCVWLHLYYSCSMFSIRENTTIRARLVMFDEYKRRTCTEAIF